MVTVALSLASADIARAYECPASRARFLAHAPSCNAFRSAVFGIGPIRIWYRRDVECWTLNQRPVRESDIMAEWQRLQRAGKVA